MLLLLKLLFHLLLLLLLKKVMHDIQCFRVNAHPARTSSMMPSLLHVLQIMLLLL